MIILHKLNNEEFALNHHHIEVVEERPDTTITLVNDKKYIVKEPITYIIQAISEFENNIILKQKTRFKTEGQ